MEAAQKGTNHRYSASKGITRLRHAICDWYKRRYDVDLDPDSEAVATIGAKEGLSHLVLATIAPGEAVMCPSPTYPIHPYSVVIAGGDLRRVPLYPGGDFFEEMLKVFKQAWPPPKMLIISFPHNPTTTCVDLEYMSRIVEFCKEHHMWLVHDFAYADLCYDGYVAPSVLQVPGAKDIAVELFSLSKSYSMPGWRMGFTVGNPDLVHALTRIKSYLDYGVFQPIQIASIIALNEDQSCVEEIKGIYKNRYETLVTGLNRAGWPVDMPKGTMFLWAKIPDAYMDLGSVEFSKLMIREAKVAVSPGIGFGPYGDEYVRFALVENEQRINQAIRGIRKFLQSDRTEPVRAVGRG